MPDAADFDPMLLSQARLGVVSVLLGRRRALFSELESTLGLTAGNLGAHLRKLEDAGYVAIDKAFEGRKPQTTCRLTPKGRKAFLAHVASLQRIAREAEPT